MTWRTASGYGSGRETVTGFGSGCGGCPPGHPSSPVETDGTPKPPEPGLRSHETPDAGTSRDPDSRPLTDAEHAEHVNEVRARLDKARADGLATDQQHTTDPDREQWTESRVVIQDAVAM